jgi:hypothetical protein
MSSPMRQLKKNSKSQTNAISYQIPIRSNQHLKESNY